MSWSCSANACEVRQRFTGYLTQKPLPTEVEFTKWPEITQDSEVWQEKWEAFVQLWDT